MTGRRTQIGGHYVADVRESDGSWRVCNDEAVEHLRAGSLPTNPGSIEDTPYLLFYERTGVKEDINRAEYAPAEVPPAVTTTAAATMDENDDDDAAQMPQSSGTMPPLPDIDLEEVMPTSNKKRRRVIAVSDGETDLLEEEAVKKYNDTDVNELVAGLFWSDD